MTYTIECEMPEKGQTRDSEGILKRCGWARYERRDYRREIIRVLLYEV